MKRIKQIFTDMRQPYAFSDLYLNRLQMNSFQGLLDGNTNFGSRLIETAKATNKFAYCELYWRLFPWPVSLPIPSRFRVTLPAY